MAMLRKAVEPFNTMAIADLKRPAQCGGWTRSTDPRSGRHEPEPQRNPHLAGLVSQPRSGGSRSNSPSSKAGQGGSARAGADRRRTRRHYRPRPPTGRRSRKSFACWLVTAMRKRRSSPTCNPATWTSRRERFWVRSEVAKIPSDPADRDGRVRLAPMLIEQRQSAGPSRRRIYLWRWKLDYRRPLSGWGPKDGGAVQGGGCERALDPA